MDNLNPIEGDSKINQPDHSEAKYLLSKALTVTEEEVVFSHLWMWEVERWKELVFALLTTVTSLPPYDIRKLVESLSDLKLLDIPTLAKLHESLKNHDLDSPYARRILEFLQENDFSLQEAQKGLITICEAAFGLHEHYSGKVQRYLRSYGELILQDLDRIFQFSNLDKAQVKYAFTYWLQNVLNMPLSLCDRSVQTFCQRYGLQLEQLFAAADELDMNLALVDDVVHSYIAKQTTMQDQIQKESSDSQQI